MENNNISINGKTYDAHTGELLESSSDTQSDVPTRQTVSAHAIHHRSQKSTTLRRQSLAAPVVSTSTKITVKTDSELTSRTQSPSITRFAPHPVVTPRQEQIEAPDIPAQPHAFSDKVAEKATSHQTPTKSPKETKDHAIQKALASAVSDDKSPKRRSRIFSMASGGLAVLLLAGYLTYISMPTISTRIAAAQSGIDASYPSYQPSGYSLAGPIGYADGQVNLEFAANAGPQSYTISERETSWDSSALLENHVIPVSAGEYNTHQQGGLTIYTYDDGAAWVNGGILYTITGDAPLSEDQILKIASSL